MQSIDAQNQNNNALLTQRRLKIMCCYSAKQTHQQQKTITIQQKRVDSIDL